MEVIWRETPGGRERERTERVEGQPRGEECRRDKDLYTRPGDPNQSSRGPLSTAGRTNKGTKAGKILRAVDPRV
jgi:hypothetical protein